MNALTRVGVFTTALVALTGAAAAVGDAVGPVGPPATEPHTGHQVSDARSGGGHAGGGHSGSASSGDGSSEGGAALVPAGLQVTEDGYTLDLSRDSLERSEAATVRFRILDATGSPVTSFESLHGRWLHLIVVRRDLGSFQHVHPVMSNDGTWTAGVDLSEAGQYRVFTDIRPSEADRALTLGHDLSVAGSYRPRDLPAPVATVPAGSRRDYEVTLDGDLVPGRTSRLTLTVRRDGEPVTDLQPYLEAYGHLVALRGGDLAYLHVHPDGEPGDGRTLPGPEVTFFAEVPSAGDYRLFLDFKHGGRVHTAAFTARAGDAAGGPQEDPAESADPTEHGEHSH